MPGIARAWRLMSSCSRSSFLNLFLNSAHAMRGKGTIAVSLTAGDDSCRISVADTGPGIPPEIRAKLFTPFVTTKSRGTGLGLSTVKRLVEAHGGTIDVDCPPEGGTIVAISLPLVDHVKTHVQPGPRFWPRS